MGRSRRGGHRTGQLICVLALSACSSATPPGSENPDGPGPGPTQTVASVVITPDKPGLDAIGQTLTLAAQARTAAGTVVSGKTFAWSSSNTSVATVSANGVLTANANGTASITATTDGVIGAATATVAQAIVTITVTPTVDTLKTESQTLQMAAVAKDANGNPVATTFTWVSSSNNIATVSSTGLVTPTGNGTAGIWARSGGKEGGATIVVRIAYVATSGGWGGFTSEDYGIWFFVRNQRAESLYVTVGARLGSLTCITPFGNTGAMQISNGGFADSVSHPAFTLSRRIAIDGALTAATAVTGTIYGYSGTYSANCGESLSGSGVVLSNTTYAARPILVTDADVKFASIEASTAHSCGLTAAGATHCWGSNTSGKLGNGTTTHSTVPVASNAPVFASITTGSAHTCGLTAAGAAYCWGQNLRGQLGEGTTTERLVPTLVPGGLTFKALNAGSVFTCGLTMSGAAYCWGNNFSAQLGDTIPGATFRATPGPVTGGRVFASISLGETHACGLTAAGAAFCWGSAHLGDGTTVRSTLPVAVSQPAPFTSLSAGDRYTCALTAAGGAYCWGFNGDGRIGDGTITLRVTPSAVTGGLTFATLDTGDDGTCGITTGNVMYCWGSNLYGKLAQGDIVGEFLTPTRVFGDVLFTKVSAGYQHSCGVSTHSVAYCWGRNDFSQLGLGRSSGMTAVPMPVLPRHGGASITLPVAQSKGGPGAGRTRLAGSSRLKK